MTLIEMLSKYPNHFLCITNIDRGGDNVVHSADVIAVYRSIKEARKDASSLKLIAAKSEGFDILYCNIEYLQSKIEDDETRILTQSEIDRIIMDFRNREAFDNENIGNVIYAAGF